MPIKRTYSRYGKKRMFKRARRSVAAVAKVATPYARRLQDRSGAKGSFQRHGNQLITGRLQNCMPFPSTMYSVHKYCTNGSLFNENLTGSIGPEKVFNLNSLYSPEFTGGGHQPQGFDQMCAIYAQYTVYKVRAKVRFFATDPSMSLSDCLCINVRPSKNPLSWTMQSRLPREVAEQNNSIVLDAGEAGQWSTGDLFIADVEGLPRSAIFDDISYTGRSNTNPSIMNYIAMACGNWHIDTGVSINYAIELEYFALWSNLIPMAQS